MYNISDGQFTSRADLIDAAGSSLGRGALVPGLGKKCPLFLRKFNLNLIQFNLSNFSQKILPIPFPCKKEFFDAAI